MVGIKKKKPRKQQKQKREGQKYSEEFVKQQDFTQLLNVHLLVMPVACSIGIL